MKSPIARPISIGIIVSATFLPASHGTGKDDAGGTLGLHLENDLFAGTDQHYTSGFKLSWSSQNLEQLSDSRYANPLLQLFSVLPYINEKDYQKNLVFALGQNIFTPVNTVAEALLVEDRSYAGWLYLGIAWSGRIPRPATRWFLTLE